MPSAAGRPWERWSASRRRRAGPRTCPRPSEVRQLTMAMPSTAPVCCCFSAIEAVLAAFDRRGKGIGGGPGRRAGPASATLRPACMELLLELLASAPSRGDRPSRPRPSAFAPALGAGLVVADVVAAFAQLETHRLAVCRVLEVPAEIAHLLCVFSSMPINCTGWVTQCAYCSRASPASPPWATWPRSGRRPPGGSAPRATAASGMPSMLRASNTTSETIPWMRFCISSAKPCHHAVDHDHRGHAQRHADDRRQRDVSRAKVTPAEEEFVHNVEGRN